MKLRTSIKKSGDGYYVEYCPTRSSYLASLSITLMTDYTPKEMVDIIEREFLYWIDKYPVPLMASAYNSKEDLIRLENITGCNQYCGFYNPEMKETIKAWKLFTSADIPDAVKTEEYQDKVYEGLPYKCSEQLKLEVDKEYRRNAKIFKGFNYLWIFWVVFIPVIIEIFGFCSVTLSIVLLIYCFIGATIKFLKMTDRWKKDKKSLEKEEDNRLKEHHHYHCLLNPEGFERLKIENFDRESREKNIQEYNKLKTEYTSIK